MTQRGSKMRDEKFYIKPLHTPESGADRGDVPERNQTKVGLKQNCDRPDLLGRTRKKSDQGGIETWLLYERLSVVGEEERNQTKVGLKLRHHSSQKRMHSVERNQTKVGLKLIKISGGVPKRTCVERNQTKVGLKQRPDDLDRDIYFEKEIRPRWD